MFTINLFRYLKGEVTFEAYGGYFEQFINKATQEELSLRQIKKEGQVFLGTTKPKTYKRLVRLAKKYGVRIKLHRKRGFPFILHRYHKRIGILIGLIFFVSFLLLMQNFVWQIEVVGNTTLKTEQIETAAQELGLKKGAFLHSLDFKAIQKELEYQLPDIAWLTVNNMGSTIVIELCEMTKSPDLEITGQPSNLVATKDGVIRYMEIYSGAKVVKPGEVVNKGDILVSGVVEDSFTQTTLVPSRGKVVAETFEEKVFQQPLQAEEKVFTGVVKKRNYLDIFGLKLPLFLAFHMDGQYEKTQNTKPLDLFGMPLPLGMEELVFREYMLKKVEYTPQEAEQILLKQIRDYETKERKEAKLISKETEKKEENGVFTIRVSYVFEENIAKEENITVEP